MPAAADGGEFIRRNSIEMVEGADMDGTCACCRSRSA